MGNSWSNCPEALVKDALVTFESQWHGHVSFPIDAPTPTNSMSITSPYPESLSVSELPASPCPVAESISAVPMSCACALAKDLPTVACDSTRVARSPWLDEASLSIPERLRRELVLRQVCDRICVLPPGKRPRTLKSFANFTRAARRVRTYTVNPTEVLQHLEGVPAKVSDFLVARPVPFAMSANLLEAPEPETICKATKSWNLLRKQGWLAKSAVGEQVRWIQAHAQVQREYSADQVAETLRDLHLFSRVALEDVSEDYGQSMEHTQCCKVLPCLDSLPDAPWSSIRPVQHNIFRKIQLAYGCPGAFFGVRGTSLQAFVSQLRLRALTTDVMSPPQVFLTTNSCDIRVNGAGVVTLKVRWNSWEQKEAALPAAERVVAVANELARMLSNHVAEIHRLRLATMACRRSLRVEKFQKLGRSYHENLQSQRYERRQCKNESALRGVQLPPIGISRVLGVPRANRKDVRRQRRLAMLKDKRQRVFRACEDLDLLRPPCAHRPWVGQPGTGEGRKLLQHLSSCHDEAAEQAFENFRGSMRAADRSSRREGQPRKKTNRQQSNAVGISLSGCSWVTEEPECLAWF